MTKDALNDIDILALCQEPESFTACLSSYSKAQLIQLINNTVNKLKSYIDENHRQKEEISSLQSKFHQLYEKYYNLYELSPVGYIRLDNGGKITAINLTAAVLLNEDRIELYDKDFYTYVHISSHYNFLKCCKKAYEMQTRQTCEIKVLNKKNLTYYVVVQIIVAEANLKHENYLDLTLLDINEIKRNEARLKLSERKFRSIVEGINHWIWCCDLSGNNTYSSPYAKSLLGYPNREIMKSCLFSLLSSQDHILLKKKWSSFIKQRSGWPYLILQYRCSGGGYVFVDSTAVPIFDRNQEVIGFLGIDRDTTERKKTEEKLHEHQLLLAQSTRVNSMSEVASILSHELNQPLAAIVAFAACCNQLAMDKIYSHTKMLNITNKIVMEAERAGAIVHRLRNFIRAGILQKEYMNLNEIIRQSETLYQALYSSDKIPIYFDLDIKIPLIKVDRIQFEQVILNLIRNSNEAFMREHNTTGKIYIQTKMMKRNKKIRIIISDNGPGFNSAILKQLFSTYYISKEGRVGIGLSICQTIVNAHDGTIEAKPLYPKGACIVINLPINEG